MKTLFRSVVTLAFLCIPQTLWAGLESFLVKRGSFIEVTSYDPKSKTYEITHQKYPGQGPLIVTAEQLSKAAPTTVKLNRVLKDPESILTQQFQIDQDMETLSTAEFEARRQGIFDRPAKAKSGSKRRPASAKDRR